MKRVSAIFAAVRRCRPQFLAGWLLSCGLLLLLVAPQAQAATRQVGIDIPVQWYADASGQMTIDRFAALAAVASGVALWLALALRRRAPAL